MRRSLVFLLFIFPFLLGAQNTMYFMERMPQSLDFNPAMSPNIDFFIQFPGLSGINFSAYNSGFNYNELKDFSDNIGLTGYNPDEFVNSIGNYNKFEFEGKTTVLAFGFRLKNNNYFSFQTSMVGRFNLKTESELAYLLAELDNLASEDFPITVDGIDIRGNNYISWSVSYSRNINEHLTLGIRPNLNFNMLGGKTNNISYIVTKDLIYDEYEHELLGEALMGLPTEINPEAIEGNELLQDRDLLPVGWMEDFKFSDFFRNATLSLDLGATYLLEKWTFSASLLNIGSSKWRQNGYVLNGKNDIINIDENRKIKIGIPPKIYLAAKRQFSPKWNYGLVLYNAFIKDHPGSSATLSLNGYVGSMLSTSLSYTAGYKFDNIGFGLRLRIQPGMDLFMVTDNVIQVFEFKKAYRMTAAVGFNFSFGVKDKLAGKDVQKAEELL